MPEVDTNPICQILVVMPLQSVPVSRYSTSLEAIRKKITWSCFVSNCLPNSYSTIAPCVGRFLDITFYTACSPSYAGSAGAALWITGC